MKKSSGIARSVLLHRYFVRVSRHDGQLGRGDAAIELGGVLEFRPRRRRRSSLGPHRQLGQVLLGQHRNLHCASRREYEIGSIGLARAVGPLPVSASISPNPTRAATPAMRTAACVLWVGGIQGYRRLSYRWVLDIKHPFCQGRNTHVSEGSRVDSPGHTPQSARIIVTVTNIGSGMGASLHRSDLYGRPSQADGAHSVCTMVSHRCVLHFLACCFCCSARPRMYALRPSWLGLRRWPMPRSNRPPCPTVQWSAHRRRRC